MTDAPPFALLKRNPDVLTCIANLSNDEVFTPPEFAARMLDTLAEGWASANDGANIWADSSVTFLDPCTKSGVFLREIAKRLIDGLADEIPDLQDRVDHILTKQLFGIAITQLTALLARRSLYCSKWANGAHSVASGFNDEDGNVWFERVEHDWKNGRCVFCGAGEGLLARGSERDSHAYALIHTGDPRARVAQIFGDQMQFDVIVGNPPYQLPSDGGTRDMPIYQKFVDAALSLDPRYALMITPSRWFAGGLGLDAFRDRMLNDRRIRSLVDYSRMEAVFPGVDFEGGVSYFLWDRDYNGDADVTFHSNDTDHQRSLRNLAEFDIFVRNPASLPILKKVMILGEKSFTEIMETNNAFGLGTNFTGFADRKSAEFDIQLHAIKGSKRVIGWISADHLPTGHTLVDQWKVLIPKSYGERGAIPAQILGPLLIAPPRSASTQTYVLAKASSEQQAKSIASYVRTKFFRFLLSLRKITQHASKPVYAWVPQQSWDRLWTDAALYEKYGITPDEQSFIESMIRPMEAAA
jgi:site-specific DNA-methyltransferase (adenine-specific)